MVALGNNLAKLCVGKKFVTNPPAKAIDGVLKSHILIGQKPWGKEPEALRSYFLGIAEMATKPKPKANNIMFFV